MPTSMVVFLKQTIDHWTSYYLGEKLLDCEEIDLKCLIAHRHTKIIAKELENSMLNNDATWKMITLCVANR